MTPEFSRAKVQYNGVLRHSDSHTWTSNSFNLGFGHVPQARKLVDKLSLHPSYVEL